MTDDANDATRDRFLSRLRTLGHVEGASTLVLFAVAMPLKYAFDRPEAVRVVGSLHGALFVALAIGLGLATRRVGLSRKDALIGAVAAVLPGGPFWFDRKLRALVRPTP